MLMCLLFQVRITPDVTSSLREALKPLNCSSEGDSGNNESLKEDAQNIPVGTTCKNNACKEVSV